MFNQGRGANTATRWAPVSSAPAEMHGAADEGAEMRRRAAVTEGAESNSLPAVDTPRKPFLACTDN